MPNDHEISKTALPLAAVIFDLDGVLVDTATQHGQAWAELARSIGVEPPPDLTDRVRGLSRLASLRIALGAEADKYSEQELSALAEKKNARYRQALTRLTPADLLPGVLALLTDLQCAGLRLALGSASRNARDVLNRLGISGFFEAICDGYSHTHAKPHPDVFLTAAGMLRLAPSQCVVIEDAEAGVEAALVGGFTVVGISGTGGLRRAHLVAPDLIDLNAERLRALHARRQT